MATGLELGAQTESAPFVFEGSVLRIETPEWVSDQDHVVAAPAYIEVAQGVNAHMLGGISSAPGSPNGLYKLGGGTLRLSGATTYRGSTRLLQGGLHVDGPAVFTSWGGIEAIAGTRLEYSPGVEVTKSLTLSRTDISQVLPADLYSPVAPPAGLEDAMGWRVEAGTAAHAGLLQGALPFVKLGAGRLDVSGDAMAYTGQAQVMEGALAINEIFSGTVAVESGARLEGGGSLASAHIHGGGTLAPGNGGDAGAATHAAANGTSMMRMAGGMSVFSSAGASIGALTVAGNVQFDPGSRFEVEALATGESDSMWVGGQASLDGEVAVLAQNGVWRPTTSYVILSARGGFDDTRFAAVSSDLAFLTPALEYGADSVVLTLKRNDLLIEDVGETPDEKEVGRVIDEEEDDKGGSVGPGPDGGGGQDSAQEDDPGSGSEGGVDVVVEDAVEGGIEEGVEEGQGADEEQPPLAEAPGTPGMHEGIVGLDRATARQALQQLTGSWNASVLSSVWDDSRFLREAVLHQSMRMASSRPGAKRSSGRVGHRASSWKAEPSAHPAAVSSAAMSSSAGSSSATSPSVAPAAWAEDAFVDAAPASWTPWTELFHSDQTREGAHGVPGDARRLDGLVLGIAAAVSASWKAGAYLGAQRSRLTRDEDAARADIETLHMGLHMAGQVAGLRLALGAARSLHRLKSSRFVLAGPLRDAPGARYDGHTTQVFGEIAWPLSGSGTQVKAEVTPFIQLAWVRTGLDGFTESGGPAALSVQPNSMAAWLSTVGLRAEAAVGGETEGASRGLGGEGRIYAQLAWHHAGAGAGAARSTQSFRDSAAQRLFTSQGLPTARQSWSLRLGLDARLGKTTDVGFAYLGRYGQGMCDQGIGGWARIAF